MQSYYMVAIAIPVGGTYLFFFFRPSQMDSQRNTTGLARSYWLSVAANFAIASHVPTRMGRKSKMTLRIMLLSDSLFPLISRRIWKFFNNFFFGLKVTRCQLNVCCPWRPHPCDDNDDLDCLCLYCRSLQGSLDQKLLWAITNTTGKYAHILHPMKQNELWDRTSRPNISTSSIYYCQ